MKKILFIALLLLISGRVFAEDYDMCCPMESCSVDIEHFKNSSYMHFVCNKCVLDKNRAFWKETKKPTYQICSEIEDTDRETRMTKTYKKCVSITEGYSDYDEDCVQWWVKL